MEEFLNFKKAKKEKVRKEKIQDNVIRQGSTVRIIQGNYKGFIASVKSIKENKYIYVTTCLNEQNPVKLNISQVVLEFNK